MTATQYGIAAMIVCNACFVANDAIMKIVAAEMPVSEAVFIRGVVSCAAFFAIFVATGERLEAWRPVLSSRSLVRALAEVIASIAFLYAIVGLPIADLTGILQVVPIAIAAGAAFCFGAPIGPRQWIATIAGLVGALLIVKPGLVPLNIYTGLAILSVATIVIRDLVTRSLPSSLPALAVAASSAVVITAGGLLLCVVEPWVWPSTRNITLLALAALFLVGALQGLVVAMRTGEIAVVGPFRYVAILFAVAMGYAIWREWPDLFTWLGMAIIVAAGAFGMSAPTPQRTVEASTS